MNESVEQKKEILETDEVSGEELRSAYELLIKRFFDTFSAFTW